MFFAVVGKKKGFDNKVEDIAYIADLLESLILVNLLFYTKVACYYTTKYIICSRIVANKDTNILYNSVIFKNNTKSFLLIQTTIAIYYTKSNQDISKTILYIYKASANHKQNVITW